jgi:cadmium resistance protein CadD (predicted permease)
MHVNAEHISFCGFPPLALGIVLLVIMEREVDDMRFHRADDRKMGQQRHLIVVGVVPEISDANNCHFHLVRFWGFVRIHVMSTTSAMEMSSRL